MEDALKKYLSHKSRVEQAELHGKTDRAGNVVKFLLSFDQWMLIWEESGHWDQRGRRKGQFVMSRKDDLGNYEPGNVFIQTGQQNAQDAKFWSNATTGMKWFYDPVSLKQRRAFVAPEGFVPGREPRHIGSR